MTETRLQRTARPIHALLFVLVFAVFSFWNSGRREFWGEEATHALTTREMTEQLATPTGWLVPTLSGEPNLTRPPLLYWLAALTGRVPGLDPLVAYRIPILLFSLLALAVTWAAARKLFDTNIAVLAVTIQATTGLWFFQSSWFGPELPFAASCQLAFWSFVLSTLESRAGRWRVLGWLGLALASLLESPVFALVMVLSPLVLFLFIGGPGRKERVRQGIAGALRGGAFLIFLVLVVPWYAYVASTHGQALVEQHLVGAHLHRATSGPMDADPPWLYLVTLPLAFLPWSVFLPLGFFHGKDRLGRPGQRAAAVLAAFVFVFACLLALKSTPVLLPLWSAPALLIAAAFFETREQFSLWEDYLCDVVFRVVPTLFRVPIFLVALAAAAWYGGLHERLDSLFWKEHFADEGIIRLLLILAGLAAAVAFAASRRLHRLVEQGAFRDAALEMARDTLVVLFVASFLFPALDPIESARPFLDRVVARAGEERLATYGEDRPAEVAYYLADRDVEHLPQLIVLAEEGTPEYAPRARLEAFLDGPERSWLLLSRRELTAIRTQFPGLRARLKSTGVEGRMGVRGEFLLFANQPVEPMPAATDAPPKAQDGPAPKAEDGTAPTGG